MNRDTREYTQKQLAAFTQRAEQSKKLFQQKNMPGNEATMDLVLRAAKKYAQDVQPQPGETWNMRPKRPIKPEVNYQELARKLGNYYYDTRNPELADAVVTSMRLAEAFSDDLAAMNKKKRTFPNAFLKQSISSAHLVAAQGATRAMAYVPALVIIGGLGTSVYVDFRIAANGDAAHTRLEHTTLYQDAQTIQQAEDDLSDAKNNLDYQAPYTTYLKAIPLHHPATYPNGLTAREDLVDAGALLATLQVRKANPTPLQAIRQAIPAKEKVTKYHGKVTGMHTFSQVQQQIADYQSELTAIRQDDLSHLPADVVHTDQKWPTTLMSAGFVEAVVVCGGAKLAFNAARKRRWP